jgi:hypothetical protein
MSRKDTELLNNVYRVDPVFLKLNEIYDKWKNHNNKNKKLVESQKDVVLLRLKKHFTRFPNLFLNQLAEVNFSCKDCFKVYILMYKFTLKRNNMRFKCKKEYLRKMIKIHRSAFDRALDELQEKNMLLIEKDYGYFYFTLNLSFIDWDLLDDEKEVIIENNEYEMEKWEDRYLNDANVFSSV